MILYAVMLLLIWRIGMLSFDNALAMANMVQLTVNLFCAWIYHRKKGSLETLLFALGRSFYSAVTWKR